jgi:hypothetical protein
MIQPQDGDVMKDCTMLSKQSKNVRAVSRELITELLQALSLNWSKLYVAGLLEDADDRDIVHIAPRQIPDDPNCVLIQEGDTYSVLRLEYEGNYEDGFIVEDHEEWSGTNYSQALEELMLSVVRQDIRAYLGWTEKIASI